jgi:tetratricopeptide (TPR) repeat protein
VLLAERDFQDRGWQGTLEEYWYLLDHANQAATYEPGNVRYRHWLNVYRWHNISQPTDPNSGEIVWPAEAATWVEQIVEEFNHARILCPTFGATWCVLGQIERVVLGQAALGAEHIREGVKLAPCDPTARLVAATLEAQEGQVEVARGHFKAVVDLDTRFFEEVASQVIVEFDMPELALELAEGDIDRLSIALGFLETSEAHAELTHEVRRRVMTLLEEKCQSPAATGRMWASLGLMYRRDNRADEAVRCYREALTLDFSEVDWRLSLAEVLAEVGQLEEAAGAAKECLLFRPEYEPAKRLLDRLSADPRLRL